MGCGISKFENEDVVRCKNRKLHIRQAVASRHTFAAAHAAYLQALKNVGAAFKGFAETDIWEPQALEPPPQELRPPPPLPPYLPPPFPPRENIIRSMSMPPLMLQKQASSPSSGKLPLSESLKEVAKGEENEDVYAESKPPSLPPLLSRSTPPPPVSHSTWADDYLYPFRVDPLLHVQEPRKMHKVLETVGEQQESMHGREVDSELDESESEESDDLGLNQSHQQQHEKQNVAEVLDQEPQNISVLEEALPNEEFVGVPNKETAIVMTGPKPGRALVDVIKEVDDYFLIAYESGKDVTLILEARKIHYHSSFADSEGNYDHSTKVLNAVSWGYLPNTNRTPLASLEEVQGFEKHQTQGSHASTLDKIFAWEKKLFDEIKGMESIEAEYEKKCTALRHLEDKLDESESLEKMKVTVKVLKTRIAVSLQAVRTATSAINRLRDEELYPQLLQLLDGSRKMWQRMRDLHQKQKLVVMELRRLDNLKCVEATSSMHMLATEQLESSLNNWHDALSHVIATQRSYIQNLNDWLQLNSIPLETLSRDEPGSPFHVPIHPIYTLCEEWKRTLEGLPDKVVLEAIKSFAATVNDMILAHADEKHHRKRAEILLKKLQKKHIDLRNYETKYMDSAPRLEDNQEVGSNLVPKDPLKEKKIVVEELQRRLDEEKQEIAKTIEKSRLLTINRFATGLPYIFQAVTVFASLCFEAYQRLYKQPKSQSYPRLTGS